MRLCTLVPKLLTRLCSGALYNVKNLKRRDMWGVWRHVETKHSTELKTQRVSRHTSGAGSLVILWIRLFLAMRCKELESPSQQDVKDKAQIRGIKWHFPAYARQTLGNAVADCVVPPFAWHTSHRECTPCSKCRSSTHSSCPDKSLERGSTAWGSRLQKHRQ